MKHVVIVANQTAGGSHLRHEIRTRIAQGPCRFTLVVPATPPHEQAIFTDADASALARDRLAEALDLLGDAGAEIKGEIGDANPVDAVGDVLLREEADEIIVSTLPAGISRWLKRDLPHRLEARYGLPVTHVVAEQVSG